MGAVTFQDMEAKRSCKVKNSLHIFRDKMFCDDDNTTVNRRESGNLSLYNMMKSLEIEKDTLHMERFLN